MAEQANQLPINPSPKARFISSKENITAHRALMDLNETQRALDYGLLEYMRVLCEQNADANGAAASHFKLRGAVEFVHLLKNLSETPGRLPPPPPDNLNHRI